MEKIFAHKIKVTLKENAYDKRNENTKNREMPPHLPEMSNNKLVNNP